MTASCPSCAALQERIKALEKENRILSLAVPLEEDLSNQIDEMLKYLAMEQGFTLAGIARLLNDCQRRMADDWAEIGRERLAQRSRRAAKDTAEQKFAHLTTLIELDEIEDLGTRLEAAERERDRQKEIADERMKGWNEATKAAQVVERALALIEKRAKTERIEDALDLTALSDIQRIVKLTTDRAYLRGELASLQQQIDQFWQYVENGWDIEDRAYCEREAPINGFGSPLAQAAHHVWKRDPKVVALQQQIAKLVPFATHEANCRMSACVYETCEVCGPCSCGLANLLTQLAERSPTL